MKSVQFTSYGTPDVLTLTDVDTPTPGPGEIVIAVAGAGINQLDTKIRSGAMAQGAALASPSGTGFDAAGTVLETGSSVEDVHPGDLVFGIGRNTLAEQAILTQWALIPDGVDPVEAGAWGVAVETANRLLTELGIDAGTIVLSGASGGVGSALIQLARGRGLRVIGTASVKNHIYLESLGAVAVAYGGGLVERVKAVAPEGIAGALDLSGAGVISDLIELVGDPAKVISISDFTAPKLGARVSTGAARTTNPRDGFAEARSLSGFSLHIERRYTLAEAAAAQGRRDRSHRRQARRRSGVVPFHLWTAAAEARSADAATTARSRLSRGHETAWCRVRAVLTHRLSGNDYALSDREETAPAIPGEA